MRQWAACPRRLVSRLPRNFAGTAIGTSMKCQGENSDLQTPPARPPQAWTLASTTGITQHYLQYFMIHTDFPLIPSENGGLSGQTLAEDGGFPIRHAAFSHLHIVIRLKWAISPPCLGHNISFSGQPVGDFDPSAWQRRGALPREEAISQNIVRRLNHWPLSGFVRGWRVSWWMLATFLKPFLT